jgi:hypothetical protein
MNIASIFAWWSTNGLALVTAAIALVLAVMGVAKALQTLVDLLPNHAVADTYFGKFIRACESISAFLTGLAPRSPKALQVRKPSAPPAPTSGSTPIGKITVIALALFIGSQLTACASISWTTPVLMAGPVAGIEEVSKAHPAPAAAGGFQLEIGLGQFAFQGHEFDALDVGALALGGVVLPGSSPVGALQLGGEIGTLNGIISLAILCTPYAVDGSGFAQGGNPGTTFGAMINVAAITSYLTYAAEMSLGGPARLPRGGL